ncbi:MAG TPA: glucokinase [Desulfobulbus sp.]|nr:glucokinase [Desulfobulbus sp.]
MPREMEGPPPMTDDDLILAGDIGATKTNLALFKRASFPGRALRQRKYTNRQAGGLTDLVASFLAEGREKPTLACFGVAGPIRNNRVRMTNLHWLIDGRELAHRFTIEKIFLINDLVATAMGAPLLGTDELFSVNEGNKDPRGNIGVIAPGTGLGEAFLLQENNRRLPVASEGGHADFAPRNRQQLALLDFLWKRDQHVSVEKVCSGIGLPNIYAFLAASFPVSKDPVVSQTARGEQTPRIVEAALVALKAGDKDHICVRTIAVFFDVLAAEAANVALKALTTGGIYIGGGLCPRMLPVLLTDRFMDLFVRGVYREMLAEIPVSIILNAKTALLGAAAYGLERSAQ